MKTIYGQFCPVAVAAEVFAERWTPVILRELVLGSRRFNEIQHGVPRISRALLVKRLRVEVRDERDLIGHGTHERVVVNVARFDQRVQRKKGSGPVPDGINRDSSEGT